MSQRLTVAKLKTSLICLKAFGVRYGCQIAASHSRPRTEKVHRLPASRLSVGRFDARHSSELDSIRNMRNYVKEKQMRPTKIELVATAGRSSLRCLHSLCAFSLLSLCRAQNRKSESLHKSSFSPEKCSRGNLPDERKGLLIRARARRTHPATLKNLGRDDVHTKGAKLAKLAKRIWSL